ncbi:peptidylprolyl isomerase [Terrimonas sp. NA20]|uniref:Peptidylprolyl isomerase n=1 Tax=Terrimonas ginsenosidimutans TaxID=2908004 RepID=A0ABS9KUM6_9BACT|nr:peptidylprolyl isomerase [Terrimonas ginsenosidimutans]MCG2616049.1 peptidylprolyl isomerase [Terrimonas ginsenosidimutans]
MLNTKRILPVLCLLFAGAVTAKAQPRKAVVDKIVAVVGDRIILHSDIRNSIEDAKRQGGTVPDNAECLLMEQALVSKVLMLQAEKDSLPVTDEEVEAELDQRVRYFVSQLGTREALEEYAGKTIYQIKDDARESVKERKLAEAMQQKIVGGVKITPNEVKAFFDRIPKDSLPFFESELEVGQIAIYPKASRDLEGYIITEMNNYKRQVESKQVTFEQLAQRYSEDPGSKDRGGQYQLNRNEKSWDPVFLSTAFRLKDGEISAPVKGKFGYHIIQMVKRSGDDAIVRHILRTPPITDEEVNLAKAKLDSIRTKIIAGTIGFNEAAKKFSEGDAAKYQGAFILNNDGSPYVTIDQLDKDMVGAIRNMKVGDYSMPTVFTDEQAKKGVRIVYLKSRSEPHRMNMRDDYSKIAHGALEQKKSEALNKWITTKLPTYYIMVDNDSAGSCEQLAKYKSEEEKGF